jgi:hypothetical protein
VSLFLELTHIGFFGNSFSASAPTFLWTKIPSWGVVVSVQFLSHYLEFNLVASVQGWRQKWLYIKDQKAADSDQYGLAPFDANKSLTKLTTWESPTSKAEVDDIKPFLAHIQRLKSAAGAD